MAAAKSSDITKAITVRSWCCVSVVGGLVGLFSWFGGWVCFLGLVVVVVVVLAAGLGLFLGCCVVIFGKSKSSGTPTL